MPCTANKHFGARLKHSNSIAPQNSGGGRMGDPLVYNIYIYIYIMPVLRVYTPSRMPCAYIYIYIYGYHSRR